MPRGPAQRAIAGFSDKPLRITRNCGRAFFETPALRKEKFAAWDDVPPFRYSEEPIPAVAARVAAAIGVLLLAALALGLLSWLGLRGPVTP
jgi:hypothetical protein